MAERFAKDRKRDKRHPYIFTTQMKEFIGDKMQNEQWSPEQIFDIVRRMVSPW